MSFRIGLDVAKDDWMDFTLEDAGSFEALADMAAWKMPQKVWYSDWRVLRQFATVLADRWSMYPREWWCVVKVVDGVECEPFWRDRKQRKKEKQT